MMYPDFDDKENTEIVELIELFEKSINSSERFYFDEDSLERILEYYEMRNLSDRAEAVALATRYRRNPWQSSAASSGR